MTIQIDQRDGLFYVYKDYKTKGQEFDYICQVRGGVRWAWTADEATIYDKQKNEVGYLYFKKRLFRRSDLHFHYKQNSKTINIKTLDIKSYKDWIFEFQIDKDNYIFSTHKYHYKSLFKDGRQLAQFDKEHFHFFNKESINIIADDSIDTLLLVILATFNYLNSTSSGETFTVDVGNILGSKPPADGRWRPTKNAY